MSFKCSGLVVAGVGLLVCFRAWSAPSGLVYHWNFDEGPDWHDAPFRSAGSATLARDSVGGADATLENMAGTNWVSGRQFSGLYFDGANNYLTSRSNLAPVLGGTASLSFWIRTKQTGPGTSVGAPGICGTASLDGIQWGFIDSVGRIGVSINGFAAAQSQTPINDGDWHHIVLTRDAGTGGMGVYVDGALSGSTNGPAGLRTAGFSSIGWIEQTATLFRGRLDQVHVFNRVLDVADVQTLGENHGPKIWSSTTVGTSGAPFTTESILFKAYDPEQDVLSVFGQSSPTNGTVAYNGDGTFTYTPAPGYSGADGFRVTVEDGKGGFASSWMKVEVAPAPLPGAEKRTTSFSDFAPIQANGANISLSGWRTPRALDWDQDGDTDLLIGFSGSVWLYRNTGSAASPAFAAGIKVKANNADIALSGSVTIALMDMGGDGVADLVAVDNSRRIRVYRNTSAANQTPVYAAAVTVKDQNGADFVLPDQRFDLGDWNGDGLPDVVKGTWDSEVRVYRNVGTASAPRYNLAQYEVLESGAYNLYPRLFDVSRNGTLDYIRGINWGTVNYWLDCPLYEGLGPRSGTLTITYGGGTSPDLHALADGAMVDFADFNGDGVYDLVLGGHAGSGVYLAYGVSKTVAQTLAEIEAIYDAYPSNLGAMLETNSQALLNQVRNAENNIINHMFAASLSERQMMFTQMVAHVTKYPFLQMAAPVNTTVYHHVPSIAGQNLLTMHQMLPDSPMHRSNVANAVNLGGTWREIYLRSGLHVGDNQRASRGQIESVREMISLVPRVIFPDTMLTLDHYYGDGRGGHVNSFTSAKNTFNFGEGSDVSEWAADLNQAVLDYYGAPVNRGDYFTFVMGHEVTHSLDGYISSRANKDFWRRKGLMLTHAAGPDVVAGTNGWIDWNSTKGSFQAKGFWDGNAASWSGAWSNYWAAGPGAAWRNLSFMRGNIDWFLDAPQEALATQANHHHAHSEARLVGAIDRFRRALDLSLPPLKANLNEVVHFLDWQSAGLNKVVLYDTIGTNSPYARAVYVVSYAWLERDDQGYISGIRAGDRQYKLTRNEAGIYTGLESNLLIARDDMAWTFQTQARVVDVLANDERLEGGPVSLAFAGQPSHGTVSTNADGTVVYKPAAGFLGADSFAYAAVIAGGAMRFATVSVEVVSANVPNASLLVEYWNNIGGSAVTDLTGNSRFPASPDLKFYTNSSLELPSNVGNNFGARVRALVVPPASGSYTFWIASDDSSELWLSSNSDASGKSRIAYVSGWTSPREWTKFGSQQSAPLQLVGGSSYYLELLHKEGSSLDNLAVAWQGPGISQQIIPATSLRGPYSGFAAPNFSQNPFSLPDAVAGGAYGASIAGYATDSSAGDTMLFTKVSGPGWLMVDADGTVMGTPGVTDAGSNIFVVRVTDSTGFLDETAVHIQVLSPEPPRITSWDWMTDGNLRLTASGTANTGFRVLAATNLAEGTAGWVEASVGSFDNLGQVAFIDLESTNYGTRFYRLSSP